MNLNKKICSLFGGFALTLCLLFCPLISYANDIENGETEVGITFSKPSTKLEKPDNGLDKIPSGPSSIPSASSNILPKTGEVVSAFFVTLGMGIIFLFLVFKIMNKRKIIQNVMEEII